MEKKFILDNRDQHENEVVKQCFDVVDSFVIAMDSEGNITMVNQIAKETLGLEEHECLEKNFVQDFIVKKQQKDIATLLGRAVSGKQSIPEDTTYQLRTHLGDEKVIDAKNIIITDKNNNHCGFLISGKDVTHFVDNERAMQKDINLYRVLANNVPDINLFMVDRNMRFILAEGKEMNGHSMSRDFFEGKLLPELHDYEIKRIWEPLYISALEGKEISIEYKYKKANYLMWVLPIKNEKDEIYAAMGITQNITEDKTIEDKLKKSKEEAEQANHAKSEFLANVSHEIRTPLNAILGFADQLLQTSLDKQQEEYVKVIDKSSEHLLSLVNDILILSKVEARQVNFDKAPFKIKNTANYVFESLQMKAKEKHIRFTCDVDEKLDMVLLGDSFRLRQILINMLNNALKFTDGGYVELKCFLSNETNDSVKVRFDVIDTGIGISPENLEKIFEQFKQVNSNITKKYGGTGLGLTICKRLIELQNGSLTISSQKGMGSTFSFILPYEKGKPEDLAEEDSGKVNTETLRDKKVLVVDDDSVNRLLAITILEKFNCDIDVAIDGKEAMDMYRDNNYDIVLLDIHMPDISGFDVARFIRKQTKAVKTKIIAVTAVAIKDDVQKFYETGMDDFLIKPYKEINLYNKICEVIKAKTKPFYKPITEIILKEEIFSRKYDLQDLRQMAGNDEALVNKMLHTFLNNSQNAIDRFKKLEKQKRWDQIGETAHKILPSYKHLKVETIIQNLLDLKTISLIDPEPERIPSLLEKTIKAMEEISGSLQAEIKELRV